MEAAPLITTWPKSGRLKAGSLVVNLKTVKMLDLSVPSTLLARAIIVTPIHAFGVS